MISDKKAQFEQELETIIQELLDSKAIADLPKFQKLSQRHHFLQRLLSKTQRLEDIEKNLLENRKLFSFTDAELVSLAEEESRQLSLEKERIQKELQEMTGEKETGRDIIIEIRAGTGGDEASLFAADLFHMYSKFIENNSWKMGIISSSRSEAGGIKEIIFEVSGAGAWKKLKFEGGVHRVQRIPSTEKSGRIHTSTATVAIMPVAEEQEIQISQNDIRIDVFRSSGPGGQSVNTTDSAVRIIHLPSGLVVSCQDEKSQMKNKEKAMKVLKSRLLSKQEEEARSKEDAMRRSMVGAGERSEKIRTYNFPQDRLTDHRIKKSWHGLDRIMEGEIEKIIEECQNLDSRD